MFTNLGADCFMNILVEWWQVGTKLKFKRADVKRNLICMRPKHLNLKFHITAAKKKLHLHLLKKKVCV